VEQITQRKIYSVFDITSEIKYYLDRLGIVWIQGELSNFKRHSSGHMYFSLKDPRAQIKAAFFRNNNMYLKFRPEDGMEVLARGRLGIYEARGDYQVIVEYLEPVGLGSLQLAFDQLKEKLRKEGLFDESGKKPLPLLPGRIGIVTSPTGAAIRDMLRILKRRNSSLDIQLYPARVQGAGAAEEIAAGIDWFNRRDDIDVIIIGRGGGSIEDLWAFNEEIVARAVNQSGIPVISAVGHEVDYTIADFVADVRASTPSAAAEMVSGVREELSAKVHSLYGRLCKAILRSIEARRLTSERLASNRAFAIAPNRIRELQQRFDEATLHMIRSIRESVSAMTHRERILLTRLNRIDLHGLTRHRNEMLAQARKRLESGIRVLSKDKRSRLEFAIGKIDALSPLGILHRGFSLCRNMHGDIVKDASTVVRGERVRVTLASGELECQVSDIKNDH
jgi:exodeoxyribonuclease VII large subunit